MIYQPVNFEMGHHMLCHHILEFRYSNSWGSISVFQEVSYEYQLLDNSIRKLQILLL